MRRTPKPKPEPKQIVRHILLPLTPQGELLWRRIRMRAAEEGVNIPVVVIEALEAWVSQSSRRPLPPLEPGSLRPAGETHRPAPRGLGYDGRDLVKGQLATGPDLAGRPHRDAGRSRESCGCQTRSSSRLRSVRPSDAAAGLAVDAPRPVARH